MVSAHCLPGVMTLRDHINEQEASVVSFMHEQNSVCSQKQLNDIAREHTIICRQLFAGHVVCSRPVKRKKHLHQMIIGCIFLLQVHGPTTGRVYK